MGKHKITVAIVLFLFCASSTEGLLELNETDYSEYKEVVNKYGQTVYMREDLIRKLDEEAQTWHWTPWLATRTKMHENYVVEIDCLADSVENFPDGWLTDEQLRRGGFLLYVMMGIYAFTLLAIVCNDYFLISIEMICEDLKLPPNVAAATFMSVGTSFPEFFVNVISTFITESDMGIGTIVGSALFNALGVAAIGGLAASKVIAIDRRPVTRDVIIYMVNVSVLVAFVWDSMITWYEATVLTILYVLYFILMFNSTRLFALYDKMIASCCNKNYDVTQSPVENGVNKSEGIDNAAFDDLANKKSEGLDVVIVGANSDKESMSLKDQMEDSNEKEAKIRKSLWRFPREKSIGNRIWWVYSWPLKLILTVTVPSPKTFRKLYPLSFIMSIIWIGVNSYFVTWSMTVIGHTFGIPDSIMGMTFLAFGGCLPEACSIFILSRRGEGAMGVSNALGANSLAILFALGLPWLIRTLVLLGRGEEALVHINSTGIDFVVGSLLIAVVSLWITLYFCRFLLSKISGSILAVLYLVFITFAILVEMGVILYREVLLC